MPRNLINELLAKPSDHFFVEETLGALRASAPARQAFYASEGLEDPAASPLDGMLTELAKDVYAIRMFNDVFCRLILEELADQPFMVNTDEDYHRQIPEVVLAYAIPELHTMLMEIALSAFNLVFFALWQREVVDGVVQIAKYTPNLKASTGWHHDKSSDFTVVIPLNSHAHVGGGTEFFRRGRVFPLPSGTALIFPASTHLHKGMPVLEGERYLMVFWLKFDPLEIQNAG